MSQSKTNSRLGGLFLVNALLFGASSVGSTASLQSDFPEANDHARLKQSASKAKAKLIPDESFANRKKSVQVSDLAHSFKNRIEIKFRENTGIRLRQQHLVAKDPAIASELQLLEGILEISGRYAVARMHEVSEENLEAMKKQGEQNTGHALSDLNLWFYLFVDAASDQELALIINGLNQLGIVEYAYASPLPAPTPGMDPESAVEFNYYWQQHNKVAWPDVQNTRSVAGSQPESLMPTTEVSPPSRALPAPPPPPLATSYVASQDYREKAPIGIDIDYVNSRYFNADGGGWGYTDVEYSWNDSHEDLSQTPGQISYVSGLFHPDAMSLDNRNHGTAVIGILSSLDNGFGTTGLVPSAAVRLSTALPPAGYNPAAAISGAANQFWKGAVILLEMQTQAGFDCSGGTIPVTATTDRYVPIEWHAASKAAIKSAVANGRIVVEAAGNGNCDLDLAGFKGAFNVTDLSKDSGAIIVGAGEKLTRNRARFPPSWGSTYGGRVDTQGEGDSKIYTTGYGDKYSAEGEDLWYTSDFGGTSGASPMVTGAAVSLSSILWEYHGSFWDPKEIRDLFRREGTRQGTGVAGHIGPRPDLRKQVEAITNRHLQMHSAYFDGDGKTDYAIYRPETAGLFRKPSTWWIRYATGATQSIVWGQKGDIPVPADITGDSRAELIVFRPSNGTWYIRNWNPQIITRPITWGQNGDIPVPLDYNGDGKAELAVYRRRADGASNSHWYIRFKNGTSTDITWGEASDTPMARDMNEDGRDDLLVYRGTTGDWWIRDSASNTFQTIQWGLWGDIPLTYRDGLSRWNIAVYRPSNNTFYARNIHTNVTADFQWGEPGDVPRFGDTDGNGRDEYIIWRPYTGVWWNANTGTQIQWGVPGDIAISR